MQEFPPEFLKGGPKGEQIEPKTSNGCFYSGRTGLPQNGMATLREDTLTTKELQVLPSFFSTSPPQPRNNCKKLQDGFCSSFLMHLFLQSFLCQRQRKAQESTGETRSRSAQWCTDFVALQQTTPLEAQWTLAFPKEFFLQCHSPETERRQENCTLTNPMEYPGHGSAGELLILPDGQEVAGVSPDLLLPVP